MYIVYEEVHVVLTKGFILVEIVLTTLNIE